MKNIYLIFFAFSFISISGCKKKENIIYEHPKMDLSITKTSSSSVTFTINLSVCSNCIMSNISDLSIILSEDSTNFWTKNQIITIPISRLIDPSITSQKISITDSVINIKKPGNRYFIGAISNSNKIFNTGIKSFETNFSLPVIYNNSNTISQLTPVSAVLYFTIRDFGGPFINECGLCYSTIPNPTINDNKQIVDTIEMGFGIRQNVVIPGVINKLNPNTKYYVRSYAINNSGINYGPEISFTTHVRNSCFKNIFGLSEGGVQKIRLHNNNLYYLSSARYINGYVNRQYLLKTDIDGNIKEDFIFRGQLDNNNNCCNYFTNEINNFEILSDGSMIVPIRSAANSSEKLLKINSNAQILTDFNPIRANGIIKSFIAQDDGKIMVSGRFTQINGININSIVRLNSNGTIDPSFSYNGIDIYASDIIKLKSGKYLLVGRKKQLDNSEYLFIRRLNINGTVDTSYKSNISDILNSGSDPIQSVELTKDEKLIISYSVLNKTPDYDTKIVRILESGNLDNSFNPVLLLGNCTDIYCGLNDRIYILGSFRKVNSLTKYSVVRITSDGIVDNSFDVGVGFSSAPLSIVETPDMKLVIGGSFSQFKEKDAYFITKLNYDGTVCN